MADLRLSVAKSTYVLQFTHSISCPNCINGEDCSFTARNTIPTPSQIVAATRHPSAMSMIAETFNMPETVRAILGLDPRQLVNNSSSSMGLDEEWMTPPTLSEEPSLTSILNATEDYESSDELSSAFPSSEGGLGSEETNLDERNDTSVNTASSTIISTNPPSEHVSLAVSRTLSKMESSLSSLNFDGQEETTSAATS
jgi:hypothetical protein